MVIPSTYSENQLDFPASNGSRGYHYQVESVHFPPRKGHRQQKFKKHPSSQAQAATDSAVQTLPPI